MKRLIYPSDPSQKSRPDEAYADEFDAAVQAGLSCSLFALEEFELGSFRPRPALDPDDEIIYRGWMLRPEAYAALVDSIENRGARAMTSAQQYQLCHRLPEWYAKVREFTAETVVLSVDADFVEALRDVPWPSYFVKDYVKSLNTGPGSLVRSPSEIPALVELLRKYRGDIEGGVCVRKGECFLSGTEERYFVLHGKAFAREGDVPTLVGECARRIASPFFSVDVARNDAGELRLIELGDGQVSDRKLWPAEQFIGVRTD